MSSTLSSRVSPETSLRHPEALEGRGTCLANDFPQFLAIARINKPQGRQGEVSAEILTDFPHRFEGLARVYLSASGSTAIDYGLERAWLHKGRVILKLSGIDSMEQAERLRGLHVLIPSAEKTPLPENSYYWSELLGCRVVAGSAKEPREVGTVTAVEPTPGTALLHVSRNNAREGEILIPLAQDICKRIDPAKKMIFIDPPEDLLELNDL